MRNEGGGGLPCTARLEDLAHRTDAGRYLNGAIDVAHVGARKREGGDERRGKRGKRGLKVRTGSDMRFLKARIAVELIGSI